MIRFGVVLYIRGLWSNILTSHCPTFPPSAGGITMIASRKFTMSIEVLMKNHYRSMKLRIPCGVAVMKRCWTSLSILWRNFCDVVHMVFYIFIKYFKASRKFSRGFNSSFISLTSMISDQLLQQDYRYVNLIRCMYKVIAKCSCYLSQESDC